MENNCHGKKHELKFCEEHALSNIFFSLLEIVVMEQMELVLGLGMQ